MTHAQPDDVSRDELVERFFEQYMDVRDRGEEADKEAWLAEHPEVADEVREYFETVRDVQALNRDDSSRDGRVLAVLRGNQGLGDLNEVSVWEIDPEARN